MYYKMLRIKHADGWNFSGWARVWDGRVVEASNALARFVNGPVEDLILWCETREVKWSVSERKQ